MNDWFTEQESYPTPQSLHYNGCQLFSAACTSLKIDMTVASSFVFICDHLLLYTIQTKITCASQVFLNSILMFSLLIFSRR